MNKKETNMEENKSGFVDKYYKIILILIFLAGILIRLYNYLQNPSLWLDEARLAINTINMSYSGLFKGLVLMQASPPMFTVITKFFISIFNTDNMFIRDMILRFFPFLTGVLSIFAFFYLLKLVFGGNKTAILTALSFLALSPAAITYTAQYKQYSLELFIAIILLVIFYRILIENKNHWYYILTIAIAPWFSYSSFFIIASGLLAIIIKDKKVFITTFLSFILSCLIYYFVSLKSVFSINYSGMNIYWSMAYSFMDLHHPTRMFYRIGDLFTMSKYVSLIVGIICFIACLIYLIRKEKKIAVKILFACPILFTLLASAFHTYPFCCRLILFLLPILLIFIAAINNFFGAILKIILGCIIILSLYNYTPDAKEYRYTYAREVVNFVKNNIKSNEAVIMDNTDGEYMLYFNNNKDKSKLITLSESCLSENIQKCADFINKIPDGKYYFLSSSYYAKEIAEEAGLKPIELDLGFKPKKCKAVYFEKN